MKPASLPDRDPETLVMTRSKLSVLPGTLEFLAMAALSRAGRMHGFEMLRWIEETSDGDFLIEEGALYPALHRMEKRGWLTADWAVSEKGRRAKYYTLTAKGRKALERERKQWGRYVNAVESVVVGEQPA